MARNWRPLLERTFPEGKASLNQLHMLDAPDGRGGTGKLVWKQNLGDDGVSHRPRREGWQQ